MPNFRLGAISNPLSSRRGSKKKENAFQTRKTKFNQNLVEHQKFTGNTA